MKPARHLISLVALLCFGEVALPDAAAQQTDELRKEFQNTKAKAEKGDANAQYELGKKFWATDENEATKWLLKAAEQNHDGACFYVGLHFLTADSPQYDVSRAFGFFLRGAKLGSTGCAYFAGDAYLNGNGTATNITEGIRLMQKSADKGYAMAQLNLANRYYEGDGVTKSVTNAIRYFQLAAEGQFDSYRATRAQLMLDYIHTTETKNIIDAAKWCRKAAEGGDKTAQYNLGVKYENGLGVTTSLTEALKWYRKAADQGDARAQYNLGGMYAKGNGVAKDETEAVKWFRKAADQGNASAQNNLAVMYDKGNGVAKDETEAVKWYRKAADQGDASAQSNLGFMYGAGNGVAKDETEAVKWYRKGADQGDATAQYNLGFMYANGNGVAKDETEAYKWWLLAGAQADERAKKIILAIERVLTSDQRAEGQRLARAFKPRQGLSTSEPVFREGVTESRPEATGSGFFITADGFLVTNEHVVRNAAEVRLVTGAGTISARVVKVDAANDLALLKVEGRFAALPVTTSRKVKLGVTVATVGFPNIGLQGFAPKLAKGEIASLSGAQDDARYFQISVPVQPGNSGGALVDERGNVVGVVSAKLNARAALSTSGALPENVNYAVKSSYLLSFLESVPEVAARLREPEAKERKFEDVVRSAEQAAVLVLVY